MYIGQYLFIAINWKLRLVKLSSVSNIESYRNMMMRRHPNYMIINDDSPFPITGDLIPSLMRILESIGSEYRTYKLDNYRVQTIIRLLTGNKPDTGIDLLTCAKCEEVFEADYSNIRNIAQLINKLNLSYCSDDCETKVKVTWANHQRYCKCGNIFLPKSNVDFYCDFCTISSG